jgi:hypothetical protein
VLRDSSPQVSDLREERIDQVVFRRALSPPRPPPETGDQTGSGPLICARANPDPAAAYAAAEHPVRHRFTTAWSMAELIAETDPLARTRPAQTALDL